MDILTGLIAGNWIAILALIVAAIAGIIVPFVLHYLSKIREARQNVINQGSLTIYINTSARVEELCKRIAGAGNADTSESALSALLYPYIINELYYLGLQTISDIDNSLKEFENNIVRFAKELHKAIFLGPKTDQLNRWLSTTIKIQYTYLKNANLMQKK